MNKYPTDEELAIFIQKMEQQELYAPKYMKEQVLRKAFPKQTVEVLSESGSKTRTVQVLAYRFKIIAGMAAAIFMLLLLPSLELDGKYKAEQEAQRREREAERMEDTDRIDVNYMLNEGVRQINRKMNAWFERTEDLQMKNIFNI